MMHRLRTIAAVAGVSLLLASHALAQVAPSSPDGAAGSATVAAATSSATGANAAPSPVFGFAQGVFGLLVVLGLIFAASWLMKKIGPRARSTGIVQVLGGASVGPREKVVVVRFGAQTLLLGVAPGHVGLLQVADGTEPVGPTVSETVPRDSSFLARLRATGQQP